ncbi:MAG: hypothetical protein JSU63_12615 [Phycisphaerales bacterium]|nr:MAG: hypothetical protein JSU63_12615 [Phycisphaerales bacterium]
MVKSDDKEVVITGVGPVTSVGIGAKALWEALAAGQANLARRRLPVDLGRFVELPIAGMPPCVEIPAAKSHLAFLSEQDCDCYRDLGYTLLAIELALADAGLSYDRENNRVGMVQAFEAPGVEHTVTQLLGMMAGPMPTDGPPPVYDCLAPSFYNMQPFLYLHLVGKAFGLHGFCTSVHNACSSGAFALEVATQQIRSGRSDAILVVGGEAFDTAVRLEWFRRLSLYAEDGQMRPFDTTSSGFYVGEGAGAIVLESASHARKRGADPYAVYLGGGFSQQGWKQAIPDVRAARLRDVIVEALTATGVSAADLDLIVPHGASTLLSDGYEASCLTEALAGEAKKAVATTFKPYVGHMLAASTIIDTVCIALSMKHQTVPATLRSGAGSGSLPVPLSVERMERKVDTVLKLSTGFTGHDAASLFGRV